MKRRTALILQMARKRQMMDEKGVAEGPGPSHMDEWRIVPPVSPTAIGSTSTVLSTEEWVNNLPDPDYFELQPVEPVQPMQYRCNDSNEIQDFCEDAGIINTDGTLNYIETVNNGVNEMNETDGVSEKTETGIPETSETGVTKVNKTSTSITKINGNKISEENESSVTKMNENGVELDKIDSDSDGAPDPFAASDDEENDPSYNPGNEISNNNILSLPDAKIPKLLTKKPKKENQRKTRKHLRQLGKEYIGRTDKLVAAKKLLPPCQNCKLNCKEKIDESQRQDLFTTFWALGDLQRQRQYVKDCMQTVAPKVERITLNATRIRGKNQGYYAILKGKKNQSL